ncbi:hypothetical protein [Aurantiacibacter gilvus]|uniref:Uncharacterized protein n=1 Tax=Aurantiacibacter gilvus TaxID=3139141 RepID=A0ABU9I9K4_9SPHN
MTWTIPLRHKAFPAPYSSLLPSTFVVDELDLLWAALTVGRPNRQTVYAHGQYSIDEAMFRQAMVRANLRLDWPGSYLMHSPSFAALDPTEKGWVNFSLGMIFAKIFAAKFLGVPWLIHFKWYAQNSPVWMPSGGSTPDFVGPNPSTGEYHVIEAKGRVGGFSTKVIEVAKNQARQPIRIAGVSPTTRIGTLLFRFGKTKLALACEDPDEDERPAIELKETLQTWQQYYRLAWELHNLDENERSAFKTLTGISLKIVRPMADHIQRLMSADPKQDWQLIVKEIKRWAASDGTFIMRKMTGESPDRRIFADGLELTYTPLARKIGDQS